MKLKQLFTSLVISSSIVWASFSPLKHDDVFSMQPTERGIISLAQGYSEMNIRPGGSQCLHFLLDYYGSAKNKTPHMYVSGNLILVPFINQGQENNDNLTVCLSRKRPSSEKNLSFSCDQFQLDYYGHLVIADSTDGPDMDLYISVSAPQSFNSSAVWNYALAFSNFGLAFNWDLRPYVDVLDTDFNSALMVTGPLVGKPLNRTQQKFESFIFKYDIYVYPVDYSGLDDLRRSWRAVTSVSALYSSRNESVVMAQRGGRNHQQFYAENLNSSTV